MEEKEDGWETRSLRDKLQWFPTRVSGPLESRGHTTLQTVHLLTSSYPQDIGTKTKTEPQKTYSAPGFPFQKGRNSREGENSEVTGNSRETLRKENWGSFVTILKQFCVTPLHTLHYRRTVAQLFASATPPMAVLILLVRDSALHLILPKIPLRCVHCPLSLP